MPISPPFSINREPWQGQSQECSWGCISGRTPDADSAAQKIFLPFLRINSNSHQKLGYGNVSVFKIPQKPHLPIDKVGKCEYNIVNSMFETVEAEITAMMPLQRACGAESQARNKLSNGPLRAQSNGISQSILRRCRQAYKCRGYVGILLSARVMP